MKYINVMSCKCFNPCVGGHHIKTSRKHVFLCESCHADLMDRLSDPVMIRGMMKSVMSSAELQQMHYERENMRLERELELSMSAAWAVAGYPQRLALADPGVMA